MIAWKFETKAFSKRDTLNNEGSPEHTLAGQLMDLPLKPVMLFGHPDESYNFPSIHKISATIAPLLDRASPLRSAHLRDPGGPQTHFAVESFMDELALALNMDPVEFRVRNLKDARDIAVIKAVAEKAGWQPRVGARKQIKGDVYVGQGIAYATRGGTRVATVAEVEVNRSTGKVWAKRFTVAQDCGQIIAPDLLRLTIEGNIVQSTSRALWEEVKFDEKSVTSTDWKSYPDRRHDGSTGDHRHHPDRSSGAAAHRRRRSHHATDGRRARQRDLRRHRHPPPSGPVHARTAESGDGVRHDGARKSSEFFRAP